MLTELNDTNFEKEVINSELPVIIDFWASWCGPCRLMAPVFEELSKEYVGKLKFAKLDTEEYQMLTMNYDIRGIPCLIVTKKGKEVDRIVGYGPKPVIKGRIDEILKKVKP